MAARGGEMVRWTISSSERCEPIASGRAKTPAPSDRKVAPNEQVQYFQQAGWVAEWFKAAVLKTAGPERVP